MAPTGNLKVLIGLVLLVFCTATISANFEVRQSAQVISGLSCNCTCAIPKIGPQEIVPVFQREGPFFFATFNCNPGIHLGYIRSSIATGEEITYSLLGTPYMRIDARTGDLYVAQRIPVSAFHNATVAAATASGRISTRAGQLQALCGPNWS